jgi:hypothetical protein
MSPTESKTKTSKVDGHDSKNGNNNNGSPATGGGYKSDNYMTLGVEQLMTMFGHILDRDTVVQVYQSHHYDMHATITQLSLVATPVIPKEATASSTTTTTPTPTTSTTSTTSETKHIGSGNSSSTSATVDSHSSGSSGFTFNELKADLFSCSATTSLAHCVSVDLRMGKGIATLFKQKFGGVDELTRQHKQIGQVAILARPPRFVYYLVADYTYSFSCNETHC